MKGQVNGSITPPSLITRAASGNPKLSMTKSPMLDGMELPSVAERVPKDAMVVLPANEIGTFGGTLLGSTDGLTGPLWEFPFSYSGQSQRSHA